MLLQIHDELVFESPKDVADEAMKLIVDRMESAMELDVPLVVRLEGTNVQQGKDILANSGLPIIPADNLGDAAKKIVAEVKEAA